MRTGHDFVLPITAVLHLNIMLTCTLSNTFHHLKEKNWVLIVKDISLIPSHLLSCWVTMLVSVFSVLHFFCDVLAVYSGSVDLVEAAEEVVAFHYESLVWDV